MQFDSASYVAYGFFIKSLDSLFLPFIYGLWRTCYNWHCIWAVSQALLAICMEIKTCVVKSVQVEKEGKYFGMEG